MPDVRDRPEARDKQGGEKQDAPPRKSIRMERRAARMKRVRDARAVRKVRVTPTKEEYRGLIKHPNGGAFRSKGSVEWPLDSFTKRRIRDGDVTVEDRKPNKPEGQPAMTARQPARGGGSGQSTAQSSAPSPDRAT